MTPFTMMILITMPMMFIFAGIDINRLIVHRKIRYAYIAAFDIGIGSASLVALVVRFNATPLGICV